MAVACLFYVIRYKILNELSQIGMKNIENREHIRYKTMSIIGLVLGIGA